MLRWLFMDTNRYWTSISDLSNPPNSIYKWVPGLWNPSASPESWGFSSTSRSTWGAGSFFGAAACCITWVIKVIIMFRLFTEIWWEIRKRKTEHSMSHIHSLPQHYTTNVHADSVCGSGPTHVASKLCTMHKTRLLHDRLLYLRSRFLFISSCLLAQKCQPLQWKQSASVATQLQRNTSVQYYDQLAAPNPVASDKFLHSGSLKDAVTPTYLSLHSLLH